MSTQSELLAALKNVRQIISDGALTGFNCHDGDWAERLFASQAQSSAAIKSATLEPVRHAQTAMAPIGYISPRTLQALGTAEGAGPVVACAGYDTTIPVYAADQSQPCGEPARFLITYSNGEEQYMQRLPAVLPTSDCTLTRLYTHPSSAEIIERELSFFEPEHIRHMMRVGGLSDWLNQRKNAIRAALAPLPEERGSGGQRS